MIVGFSVERTSMEKECIICGKIFYPLRRNLKNCIDCQYSTTPIKMGNYKPRFYVRRKLEGIDGIRERARIRDRNKCRLCDKAWEKGRRLLDVHHLDLRMESSKNYEYDKANLSHLITLCHKCHMRLHFITKRSLSLLGVKIK
jgi:hypothetical protein